MIDKRYLRNAVLLFFLIFLLACQTDSPPRKIEILFLGHDSEHHNSESYLPLLASALTKKGINFTYTADPNDLNTENLKKYDGLALYANHDSISPPQEKALLDFVRSGKGFVPIHCASYCFRNSEEFVSLVGAQFMRHDTGTFTAKIIQPDHPIMQGFLEFETWDETYEHQYHSENRTILMERIEGDYREPWTWVSTYGKGRVFYTAYGHDERTWNNPGFHDLMERGILWAVGEELSSQLSLLSFPSLKYSEASIPNYEERDPPPQLQEPLSPEESLALTQIPPGFELSLFASEPDIKKPVSMAWDEKGRLWLLETTDYPNDIRPANGEGNDKIKILEDTDGDGKADKVTVFADNLSIPTSLVFANDGLIVAQAPQFLFLKDTDGDDKADVREILMTGWDISDTHAGPSNLKYGFDNWIWGTVGYAGFKGRVGGDSIEFRQGIYRFRPDGSKMEFMGATTNNTWGLGFSESFDVFVSTANNTHSAFWALPATYLEGVTDMEGREVIKIDGHYGVHPNTQNIRQVDVFGGFTAAAGHNLYTARSFPKEYWNRVAFVCEPTAHLLHRAILEKAGSGFEEKDGWNMLASADEWVSPVHAEVGPDGALWVLDWYNFIVQHNPTPEGFETGTGNAYLQPLRDKERGRIYRIVYKNGRNSKQPNLKQDNPKALIKALKSKNLLWRMHAQRLLVERGKQDVLSDLFKLVENQNTDEIGLNSPAVHALWTIHGLGALDGSHQKALLIAEQALNHSAAGVRKAAIQVLPRNEETFGKMFASDAFHDEDGQVRLTALWALCEMAGIDEVGALLYKLNQDSNFVKDQWLAPAIYVAMVKHSNSLIKHLHAEAPSLLDSIPDTAQDAVHWESMNLNVADWKNYQIPGVWEASGIERFAGFDGVVWFRKTINLSAREANSASKLFLGPIDDSDETFINGLPVGSLIQKWKVPRVYDIPKGLLKTGRNVIAIRVEDTNGNGGFHGEVEDVFIQFEKSQRNLSGIWKYKIEKIFEEKGDAFADGATPLELFLKNYGPYANQFAAELKAQNESPADQQIFLKTLPGQMQYDQKSFSVTAGTTVEIVFENNDDMQHNLLIVKPGSLEVVGAAAEHIAKIPSGPARGYIPNIPHVLASTVLVDPGQTFHLRFEVPDVPGEYPYVCTFPGHWKMMNGVMEVVKVVN